MIISTYWSVFIGLMALPVGQSSVTERCPFWKDAIYASGKCYKGIPKVVNYDDALKYCQEQELATIAEIHTDDQQMALKSILLSMNGVGYLWLGARATNGVFRWSSNNEIIDWSSSLWASGEPNADRTSAQDCVMSVNSGKICDILCNITAPTFAFACQKDERPVTDPCYFWEGSTYVNGKCFKHFSSTVKFDAALKTCRAQGATGTLAEFLTLQEKNVVSQMIVDKESHDNWIGYIRDQSNPSSFVLISTNQTSPGDYYWGLGEPDDKNGGENCIVFDWTNTEDPLMYDKPCTHDANFTCQITVDNPCDQLVSPKAEYYKGRCFLFVNQQKTWQEANQYCKEMNSYLAEPTLELLQNYILDMAARNPPVQPPWVGGHWSPSQGRWASSNDIITTITPSQTNNCFLSAKRTGNIWLCVPGNPRSTFICETDIGDPCESILPGSVYNNRYCHKYVSLNLSWADSLGMCWDEGAMSVEITSSYQSQALNNYLKYLGVDKAWIAAERVENQNNFKWASTKTALSFSLLNSTASLTPFEQYLVVKDASYWLPERNDSKLPFVCVSYIPIGISSFRSVATSLPNIPDVPLLMSQVQVSCDMMSKRVSVNFSQVLHNDSILTTETKVLEPGNVFNFSINSEIFMSASGVYSGHVLLETSWPVTAVLKMVSENHNLSASTLLLPNEITEAKNLKGNFIIASGCSQDCSGYVVSAMTLSDPSEISLLFRKTVLPEREVSVGNINLSHITTARGSTVSQFGSFYLSMTTSYDGGLLSSEDTLSVVVASSQPPRQPGEPRDFTLDQLLPAEFLDRYYFSFPSLDPDVDDFVKVVAVENNTEVEVSLPAGTQKFILLDIGDSVEIPVPNDKFYQVRGSKVYYAYKMSRRRTDRALCMTSLLPYVMWKHRYEIPLTSQLDGYNVVIAAIFRKWLLPYIMLDHLNTTGCLDIDGTDHVGCYYKLSAGQHGFYHLSINNTLLRLCAYIIASSPTSLQCNSLGVRDSVSTIYSFDRQQVLASYNEEQVCNVSQTTLEPCDLTCAPSTETLEPDSTTRDVPTTTTESLQTTLNTSPTSAANNSNSIASVDLDGLSVDVKKTSAYRREKTSAPDERVSSITIGSLGIICIAVTFGIIVLSDLITFCKTFENNSK